MKRLKEQRPRARCELLPWMPPCGVASGVIPFWVLAFSLFPIPQRCGERNSPRWEDSPCTTCCKCANLSRSCPPDGLHTVMYGVGDSLRSPRGERLLPSRRRGSPGLHWLACPARLMFPSFRPWNEHSDCFPVGCLRAPCALTLRREGRLCAGHCLLCLYGWLPLRPVLRQPLRRQAAGLEHQPRYGRGSSPHRQLQA